MSKIRLFYACIGFGGVIATTLTGVAIGGGFSSRKYIDPKYKVYTWDCYKWIVDRKTAGEVWACYDKRGGEKTSQSLIFVLWWLKGKWGEPQYNTFTEIEKINLDTDKKTLSFVFASGQDKYDDRKLKDPNGLYWRRKSGSSSEVERQPPLDWNKISGKDLKSTCKLEGNNLVCGSDFTAAQERVQSSPRFRLIY